MNKNLLLCIYKTFLYKYYSLNVDKKSNVNKVINNKKKEVEHDPVSNWNWFNRDPSPEPVKRSRLLHKRKIGNRKRHRNQASRCLKDDLAKGAVDFSEIREQLHEQKKYWMKLSHDIPKYVSSLKYSLKPEFINWKLQETLEATNIVLFYTTLPPKK